MSVAVETCPECEARYLLFEGHRCRVKAAREAKAKAEAAKPTVVYTFTPIEPVQRAAEVMRAAKLALAEKEKRRAKWERAQRRRFARKGVVTWNTPASAVSRAGSVAGTATPVTPDTCASTVPATAPSLTRPDAERTPAPTPASSSDAASSSASPAGIAVAQLTPTTPTMATPASSCGFARPTTGRNMDARRRERFLRHVELTKSKPKPVQRHEHPWTPPASLADLLPEGTKLPQASPLTEAEEQMARATAHLTSLPLPAPEPPPVEPRRFVDLDGQKVRVAETPEQVLTDEALYGVVAVEKMRP